MPAFDISAGILEHREVTKYRILAADGVSPKGIAVARNGEVVPKSAWGDTVVSGGDRIEIVTAAAGG